MIEAKLCYTFEGPKPFEVYIQTKKFKKRLELIEKSGLVDFINYKKDSFHIQVAKDVNIWLYSTTRPTNVCIRCSSFENICKSHDLLKKLFQKDTNYLKAYKEHNKDFQSLSIE